MLDVIHYFFDQDNNYSTAEQAEAHSAVRRAVFREWYGTAYRYGIPEKTQAFGEQAFFATEEDNTNSEVVPVDPFKKVRKTEEAPKPFIPATDFNENSDKPFGSVLDAPIG